MFPFVPDDLLIGPEVEPKSPLTSLATWSVIIIVSTGIGLAIAMVYKFVIAWEMGL